MAEPRRKPVYDARPLFHPFSGLKLGMAAIAKRSLAAMLAAAEVDRAVLFGLIRGRTEVGSFMGTVAKGLGFALAAGAPMVGLPGFDFDRVRSSLRNGWFVHENSVKVFSRHFN